MSIVYGKPYLAATKELAEQKHEIHLIESPL